MAPRFLTILTGSNLPKIQQPREPEPSTINEKTVADFTRVVEQAGILDERLGDFSTSATGRVPDARPRIRKPCEGLMANKSQGTWYVSFDLPPGRRVLVRATETFPNEREAKKFARAQVVDTPNVTAGTLNPHLPKRTIASRQILEWLEQADEPE